MTKPPYRIDLVHCRDWEFFYKYLALSLDQQEQLHLLVDAMLEDSPVVL